MPRNIALPDKTAQRLTEMVRQRESITAMIETTVLAIKEALNVPEDWQLRDIAEGFVAPQDEAVSVPEVALQRENGAMEMVT